MSSDIPLFSAPSESNQSNGGGGQLAYPQPWLDYASTVMPNSLTMVLRWAEFIWNSNGTYKQALQRTARYFLTDLVFKDVDDEQARELRGILEKEMKIISTLSYIGDDFLAYGNVFIQRYMPFDRYLSCSCGYTVPFDRATDEALWLFRDGVFNKSAKKGCPGCGNDFSPWKIIDRGSKKPADMRLRRLSPHEMEIGYNPYSGRKKFYWKIPEVIKAGVKKGIPLILRDLPVEIIDCICTGTGIFEFDDDVVFHQAESVVSGVYTGGWGLPRVIANFRLAFHHQVLNRFDQAIAMDYINGMRVISPESSNGSNGAGDPLVGLGGSNFRTNVERMVKLHKKDPNTWSTSPIPLKYQLFGGEGQQLSPKDLTEAKLNEWLDASGVPAELFHATLNIQTLPVALRIFENSWPEVVSLYNNILEWLTEYMTGVLNVPEFHATFQKVRQADDLERRQIMLQLMSGRQVAPQTALATFGINDPREELRKSFEWQKITAEEEKAFEEGMEKAQAADMIKKEWQAKSQGMAAGGAPGGAPMDPAAVGIPAGPQPPSADALSTPESMDGEAQRLAEEIIGLDATTRRQQLIQLKKTNELLHSLVKSKIEKMEQQAKTQGVTMLRQQGQMAPPGG